ncbi:hypothetical protein BD311DRAFT_770936 [Dichomitus squalens]|uniref:Secreted protein n=1 Tax=Dichomitus squalens TaxID=114155 RepID=A0A4Q9M8B9_9APHY|nr:hypothetical protein BD311DRAFT_770936 [Dichomitus squalens]
MPAHPAGALYSSLLSLVSSGALAHSYRSCVVRPPPMFCSRLAVSMHGAQTRRFSRAAGGRSGRRTLFVHDEVYKR